MSDEEESKCECPPGLPGYLATFADLMSLLMCFFVLLLSFSEMDALKFKRLAGSMKQAFGVQNQVNVNSIPKGTSIIAQNFSPGKPDPTPIQTVMQKTTDSNQQTLEVLCQAPIKKAIANQCGKGKDSAEAASANQALIAQIKALTAKTENDAVNIAAKLEKEIRSNMIEVETKGRKIIIRVQEKGSFPSGSAELQPAFIPVLDKLREAIKHISGPIAFEGHTDNVPIHTYEFPSNWDLSVARALAVFHGVVDGSDLDQSGMSITGWGDTQPLVPNDTPEDRARNRRVEIILKEALDKKTKEALQKSRKAAPNVPVDDGFSNLNSNEIF
jgi:chemotaxis protein MotB